MLCENRKFSPSLKDHYDALTALYSTAPINEFFEPRLAIRKGEADLRITVQPKFFHAAGSAHGSLYFKAIDDTAFFAANSMEKDVFVLTASMNIQLIRPVNSGEIIAEGKVLSYSRKLIIAEAILYNSKRKEIGRGTGNFLKSDIKLNSLPAYSDVFNNKIS